MIGKQAYASLSFIFSLYKTSRVIIFMARIVTGFLFFDKMKQIMCVIANLLISVANQRPE